MKIKHLVITKSTALLGAGLVLLLASNFSCHISEIKQVRRMTIENIPIAGIPDGEYRGSFRYGNFTYEVATTVYNGRITDIKILKNRRLKYARMAEQVVERVLQKQRLDVDAISGATTTSKALLKAIENSLRNGVKTEGL